MKAIENKAKAIEVKVALAASQAIEGYKNFESFKEEVGEAVYDTYLKGFN